MVNYIKSKEVLFSTNITYCYKKEQNEIVNTCKDLIFNTCCEHLDPVVGSLKSRVAKSFVRRISYISRSLAHAYESIYLEHTRGINFSRLNSADKRILFYKIFNEMVETADKMLTPDDEFEEIGARPSVLCERKYSTFIKSGAIESIKSDLSERIGLDGGEDTHYSLFFSKIFSQRS